MNLGLPAGHAGDKLEVAERRLCLAPEICQTEVRRAVAGRAQADQSAQLLDAGHMVVGEPLVRLHEQAGSLVGLAAAGLAAVVGPAVDHLPDPVPVPSAAGLRPSLHRTPRVLPRS